MHGSQWNRRTVLRTGGIGALGLAISACGREAATAAIAANVVSTSADPVPLDAVTITPDDPRLTFSSFASIAERSSERFRATRFEDGQGLGAVSPCGRLAFRTTSSCVAFDITFPDEVDGHRIVDGGGAWDPFYADILIDGRLAGAIVGDSQTTGAEVQTGSLAGLPVTDKRIELIWPYERAMTLVRVKVASKAVIAPAPAPVRKLVCAGDSITQGYAADRPSETYAFLLARHLDLDLINMGFASRIALASDGIRDGRIAADFNMYMIGVNDFLLHVDQKRSLFQFGNEIAGYLRNWFQANTSRSSRLYVISPLHTTKAEIAGLRLQAYRDTMKTVCAAFSSQDADRRLRYIDGGTLLPASPNLLFDGLHPETKGHATVARRLAGIIQQG